MAKRISKTVQAYRKERKRVRDYISRKKREGFDFDFKLPDIPDKITRKDVNYLKSITHYKLKKYGTYAGYETYGEIVSAYEGEKLRRKNIISVDAIKKELEQFESQNNIEEFVRDQTDNEIFAEDILIDRLFEEIEKYPGKLGEYLLESFTERLNKLGRKDFGDILYNMPEDFWNTLGELQYDSDKAVEAFDYASFSYFSRIGVDDNEAINM